MNALEVKFGPSSYENPKENFTKLRKIKTVEEYQSQFEALSKRIKGLAKEFRIITFISGLSGAVGRDSIY